MFEALLRPIVNEVYPVNIESVRNNTQKELRIIDTLEPIMNQHRLVIDYSLCDNDVKRGLEDSKLLPYSLLFQLTHITKDRQSLRHDDRLDALTMGVNYWLELDILEQNTEKALEKYNRKQLEKKLKEFAKSYKKNPINNGRFSSSSSSKGSKQLTRLKAFKRT